MYDFYDILYHIIITTIYRLNNWHYVHDIKTNLKA